MLEQMPLFVENQGFDINSIERVRALLARTIRASSETGARKITINSKEVFLNSSKGPLRSTNQDRVVCSLIEGGIHKSRIFVAAISDGMGGLIDGEKAASDTLSCLITGLAFSKINRPICDIISEAIDYANEFIHRSYNERAGATLSAIVVVDEVFYGANVGDSRIYIHENGKLQQLSKDDTVSSHIPSYIDPEDSWLHPERIDNRLAQYVGMGPDLSSHVHIIHEGNNQNNAFFLMTTDGAHYIGNKMLEKVIQKAETADVLVKRVIFLAEWLSGHDNATLLCIPTDLKLSTNAPEDSFLSIETTTVERRFNILCDVNFNGKVAGKIVVDNIKSIENDSKVQIEEEFPQAEKKRHTKRKANKSSPKPRANKKDDKKLIVELFENKGSNND